MNSFNNVNEETYLSMYNKDEILKQIKSNKSVKANEI